jgi:S-adenosylmethionine decarboxylase
MDYRIRGFTRDVEGKKFYKDHSISSIQDYLSERTLAQYQLIDVNVYPENFFHTKMMLKDFSFDNYLFGQGSGDMSAAEIEKVEKRLKKEMTEIFYGMNMPD